MLSDRKKKILQVVIDDYINSATPVSSKSIHDSHLENLSSATIRNELASLEELGFLTQPHTSAGRVPTNLAYQHYIDGMLKDTKLTAKELLSMKKYFSSTIREAEYIASNAVKVLSDMTNYTSIGSVTNGGNIFQSIKLVKLSENTLVLITVSESGNVADYKVYGNFLEGDEYLKTAESILNKHIVGKTINDIDILNDDITTEFKEYRGLFSQIFTTLKDKMEEKNSNLYLMGGAKIFEHKEFNNVDSAKGFMNIIDSKEKLNEIMKQNAGDGIDVNVTLGGDDTNLPKDCCMITANYTIDDVDYGTYGVIGPARMDYNKVISVLHGIRDVLGDILK